MTDLSKMKVSLDRLAAFLAVADAGGLAGAARMTGISQPTLSRHMTRLETELGKRLFLRGVRGYALTADGRALVPLVRRMVQDAQDIRQWAETAPTSRPVRISAGSWTALWLASRLQRQPNADWQPEFVTAEARLDIARREVDIGIRNMRPNQPWLAAQPFREIRYAAFARDHAVTGWVLAGSEARLAPSARWLVEHHGDGITARANDPRLAAQLAMSGHGRVILPVFAAPLVPGLTRVSGDIDALTHREWLISHHDTRHDPPVRAALTRLAQLMRPPDHDA